MKKFLLFFVLCFINFSETYAKSYTICDIVLREHDNLYYKKFTNKPFSGLVEGPCNKKRIFLKANLKQEKIEEIVAAVGKFKNGKKIGKWIEYHGNGMIGNIQNFKKGELDGKQLYFDNSGFLYLIQHYISGKENGIRVSNHKYPSGLTTKVEFKDNKRWNGDVYYIDYGNENLSNWSRYLRVKGTIKEGKLHGQLVEYDKKKNIINVENWDSGVLISEKLISKDLKYFISNYINK